MQIFNDQFVNISSSNANNQRHGRSQVFIVWRGGGSWGTINLSIETIIYQILKLYCKFLSFPKCFEKLLINISIILESFAIFLKFFKIAFSKCYKNILHIKFFI